MVPLFLVLSFITNIFLLQTSVFYFGVLIAQVVFFLFGLANLLGWPAGKMGNLCKFFLVTLAAQALGWIRMFVGISDTVWTPER